VNHRPFGPCHRPRADVGNPSTKPPVQHHLSNAPYRLHRWQLVGIARGQFWLAPPGPRGVEFQGFHRNRVSLLPLRAVPSLPPGPLAAWPARLGQLPDSPSAPSRSCEESELSETRGAFFASFAYFALEIQSSTGRPLLCCRTH